jgi:hypothetical protein
VSQQPAFRPTIAVDFDGCIHSYERGWQGGEIYGTVVPGFFDWLFATLPRFEVVIHSSRANRPAHVAAMHGWIQFHYHAWREMQPDPTRYPLHLGLEIRAEKPPAWLTIDDRCIRFDGHWDELALTVPALLDFKPWMTRPGHGGGELT